MNYKILEIADSYMVFEMYVDAVNAEVRVNCEVDENHLDGSEFDTVMLDCPSMVMSEMNVRRFVRDFTVLGLMAIKKYEERYAPIKQQTEDSFLDY